MIRFQAGDSQIISSLSADNYAALEPEQKARHFKLYDAGPGLEYNFLMFNLNDDIEGRLPEIAANKSGFAMCASGRRFPRPLIVPGLCGWFIAASIEGTVEYRIWHGLRHIITVRSSLPSLDASLESEILDPVNPAVLVFLRRFPTQTMVGVYNMTTKQQKLPRWVIPLGNWAWDALTEESAIERWAATLGELQVRWSCSRRERSSR